MAFVNQDLEQTVDAVWVEIDTGLLDRLSQVGRGQTFRDRVIAHGFEQQTLGIGKLLDALLTPGL